MLRHTRALLRVLGRLALVAYFLIALSVLGVRYWLLPNIDQFRPYVAQQLSLALDTQVSIDAVSAQWKGLNPSLALQQVTLTDKHGRQVFSVPAVRATLSWRSLLMLQPRFLTLQVSGMDLTLRRDAAGHLHVLGRSLDLASANTDSDLNQQAIGWLASQRQIALHDTVLRWVDETRDAKPLILQGVTLNIQNHALEHKFSLVAKPPPELGELVDIRGDIYRSSVGQPNTLALETGQGRLYMHIGGMQPLGWLPWLDMPNNLESGQVSAQAWLQIAQGKVNYLTADVQLTDGRWVMGDKTQIAAKRAHIYLDGPTAAFSRQLLSQAADLPIDDAVATSSAPAMNYQVQVGDLSLRNSPWFDQPIALDSLVLQGLLSMDQQGLRLQAQRLDLHNPDVDASLHGEWRSDQIGGAGTIDLQGRIGRLGVAALHKYLPNEVDIEVRDWLSTGLAAGDIYDASLLLQGQLNEFPFAEHPELGLFQIAGKFRDVVIDYLPPQGKDKGWPAVADMQGRVAMRRAGLLLKADSAVLRPDGKAPVHASQLSARIDDMANAAVLQIDGHTQGEASAYLGLMTHSPLGALLDGMFDHSSATGVWQVPLSLTVPLLDPYKTTAKGAIQFAGGNVSLASGLPPLTKVQGELGFTEQAVSTSTVQGQFMGGAMRINGTSGDKSKGLVMQGRSSAAALSDYVGLPGMQRLQGDLGYTLRLRELPSSLLALDFESDLIGLALDLPEPLSKPAQTALPLRVSWHSGKKQTLNIALGQGITARFLHKAGVKGGPYFYAGTIGVHQQPAMPVLGTHVDILYPDFDADAWNQVVDEFMPVPVPVTGKAGKTTPVPIIFPDLQQLRLQAHQARFFGVLLDELTYTILRPDAQRWRMDISSSETAGTLQWREVDRKITGPVQANFHRLALGADATQEITDSKSSSATSSLKIEGDLNLPNINLQVKNLSLYGRDAGELTLVGVKQTQGTSWKLEKLTLTSPDMQLAGTGTWRLYGPDRGLSLDAKAEFSDVGKYFDQLGFTGLMAGGQGEFKGAIEWRNMPWEFSRTDLKGTISFALDKGRFQNLGSKSARLLELLSFQSFSRLARLDLNPSTLVKNGFPYDSLRGSLLLDHGVVSTSDYRIIGPVGTIVLDGKSNLEDESLDAQAVVIPNLDVSGAAIAAGIAINPIVGIGAFLTQWLLKEPLAKAMTVQYHISGNWNDPKITEREH
ncbi:MAG: TIGR02099 family protein [Burkholderiaceae bacterium]|nr:TIGR02099 family protein [Burkholderiaceae bacterium]